MFWNDPSLYGASLPYKDFTATAQTPFLGTGFAPWQNIPKHLPQTYYGNTPFVNLPQQGTLPFLPQTGANPFYAQQGITPFLPQMGINPVFAQQGITPFLPQMGINPVFAQQGVTPFMPQMGFNPVFGQQGVTPLMPQMGINPVFNPYVQQFDRPFGSGLPFCNVNRPFVC